MGQLLDARFSQKGKTMKVAMICLVVLMVVTVAQSRDIDYGRISREEEHDPRIRLTKKEEHDPRIRLTKKRRARPTNPPYQKRRARPTNPSYQRRTGWENPIPKICGKSRTRMCRWMSAIPEWNRMHWKLCLH